MIVKTGDRRLVLPIKPIYSALGQDLAESLLGFHTFTGSDSTGKFAGKGKRTCWNTLIKMKPHVIDDFRQLGKMNTPTQAIYEGLEECVCKLYAPRTNETNIEKVRWQLSK